MSKIINSVAHRLRSAVPKQEYQFQVRTGDKNSHGTSTLTVYAKNPADAWAQFVKEHKSILPYLRALVLLGD